MKRKLFLLLCALLTMIGVTQVKAYTLSELTSAGWTKVTSISDVDNNYYVFVDAGSSNYAMGRLSYGNDKPVYQSLVDPFGFNGVVWYLGANGDNYTIRSIADDHFFISGTQGWNDGIADQQWGNEGLFKFTATLPEGKFSIQSVQTNSYVGPWNNDNKVALTNGYENIAANKAANQAPGFYLYSIPRAVYNANRITASWLTSHGWSQVIANSALGNTDNYYLIIEKETFGYAMARTSNGRPASKSLSNPFATKNELWLIAAKGSGYSLQNVVDGTYFTSAAGDWNTSMSNTPNADIIATVSEGVYTLSAGGTSSIGHWRDDKFFPYENENVAANKNDNNRNSYYIYTISKADYATQRAAYLASLASSATSAAPVELTNFIFNNSDFATLAKLGWTVSGTWGNQQTSNGAYETWNSNNVSVTQELANMPGGKYKLTVQMVSGNDGRVPYLYANADKEYITNVTQQATTTTYDGMRDEIAADPNYGLLTVNPNVTNGTLTVGMKAPSGWVVFDNFKLSYYGPTLASSAVVLPNDGVMTAGQWYYFDIAVAGDNYNATATNLDDIICFSDGNTLVEEATSGDIKLKATDNSFAVGRYYVKSSSDNNLVVAASSYEYNVSEATADKAYVQASQTVTVSYTVSTNDPAATLAQNYSGVTLDGVAINVTPGASGFTFTLPANLEAGVPHTLYIPAGAIGYEAGSTYNAEQSIVLNATAIYDGIYYLKVENESAAKGKYLSRGNANGVHATIDFYGIPVQVVTNGNNETTLQAYDSKQYYVHAGQWNCNANGETSANGLYTITLNGGKYRIHNNSMEAGRYFKYNDNALGNVVLDVYDDGTGSNSGPIIDWSVETLSEHNAVLGTYTTKNYANVIEDAGLEVAPENFVAYLASNYAAKDKTSSVGTAKITNAAGSWAWTGVREQGGQPAYNNAAEAWQATGSWSQTIENLPSGIYKVTVNAFERDGGWSLCNTLGAEGYEIVTSYFKANDELVQLKSWYSEKTGTNNPNSMAEAATAFNNDKYKNEVYTYVADGGSGTGSLTITIAKPGFIGDNWLLFNNVYLTYYDSSVSPEDAAAILEEATTAMNSPMKPSLYQALATANSAFEGSQTVPNYNALRTAIDNCATSIASYAAMNTNYLERITSLIDNNNVYSSTASGYVEYAAYKSKYDNYKDAQTEDIDNATANSLNAYNGDKGTRPVDLVLMPSWTIGGVATGNKFYQNTWSDEGAGDGTNFLLPFYEYWVSGEKVLDATTLQATQTGLTAKGIYKVSAWVRVQESTAGSKIANGITMQVGEGPSVDVSAGEKIGETNRYIGEYTAYGQADNDGNLVIKFVVAEGSNISWLAFKNLNYEEATAANLKVADGKLGTFIAPFDVTLPENVKAYSATVENNEVKLSKIAEGGDKLDAGTPVIVYGDGVSVDETFYGDATVTENQTVDNLVGILNESEKEVPAGAYVLQTQTGGQAFYKVASAAPGALNRCYVIAASPNARLVITFDGEDPTAINAIEAAEAEDGALKDGKYIIDNKVVIVKNGVKYSANGQILK